MEAAPLPSQDLERTTAAVMDAVRGNPAAPSQRLALFQLACVNGDWARAKRQLEVVAGLPGEGAIAARVFGALVDAEAQRRAVLAGQEPPTCLGAPPDWVAMLSQALALEAGGEPAAAASLRRRALDAAEPSSGTADGVPFAWIMDADPRFGPVLEVIVNGAYRWLPFVHLRALGSEPPRDLVDLVWLPAKLTLAGGAEVAAFLPVRYPGSEAAADPALRMARQTVWQDTGEGGQIGLGQRLLADDQRDHPLLDLRRLVLDGPGAAGEAGRG